MLKHADRPTDIHCSRYAIRLLLNRKWSIVALVVALLSFPPIAVAIAVKADDQITNNILDNTCENSAWSGGTKGLGPQLNMMCYRPNAGNHGITIGGNIGTAQSLHATITQRRRDRLEAQPSGRQASLNLLNGLSVYASGNIRTLDRMETPFSNRSDSTISGATMGADFRVTDRILAGVAFNYLNRPRDLGNNDGFATDAYGLLSYVSFIPTFTTFLDLSLGYSQYDYVLGKSAFFLENSIGPVGLSPGANHMSGNADSETDVHEVSFKAASGYDHNFSSSFGSGKIGPRMAFAYSQLAIAPYAGRDQNDLAFTSNKQSIRSIQGTIGIQGSMRMNTSYGVFASQATADYVHQFNVGRRNVTGEFAENQRGTSTKFSLNGNTPDRSFLNFTMGTVLVLPDGILPFLSFRLATDDSHSNNYAGIIGVRIEGS